MPVPDQTREVAVVTGGASGFGLALAARCAASGRDVVLLDLDGERATTEAATLADAHPVRVEGHRADVSSGADLTAVAGGVDARFGRCDLLFVNVGVQQFGAVERLTDDDWRWLLDVNVIGAARTVRAFLPLLRRGGTGRIAFTASANVLAPAARLGAYQASKAALVALAETLRIELAPESIQVSVIFPAGMITRHLESSLAARPADLRSSAPRDDDRTAMLASRPLTAADLTTADAAAGRALDEVLAGEPYVVTHGELAGPVARHHAAIERALARMTSGPGAGPAATSPASSSPVPVTAPAPAPGGVTDDIEAIKQLKARYFRLLDTKDWDGFGELFAKDVQVDTRDAGGGVQDGVESFVSMTRESLARAVSVHHGHTPEITLTSPTAATGVWAMEDRLQYPDGGPIKQLHGFGHYHETYVKAGGTWLIASLRLTRLRTDFA